MKNAVWLLLRLRVDLGLVFAALPQTRSQTVIHTIKDALAIGRAGRERALLILILMECSLAVIVFCCFLWYWRPKRHTKEYRKDPADEERIEVLEAKIGMLQMDNKNLTHQLAEAKATADDFKSAIQASVAFDREVTVTVSGGERYTFVFTGCEPRREGAGFLGLYGCPLCSENRLDAREGEDPGEKFRNHLGECPSLQSAPVSERAMGAH